MTKQRQRIMHWLFNASFLICKEGPGVNNFTKSFAHISNRVLSSELYSEDFFSQILNQYLATFYQ